MDWTLAIDRNGKMLLRLVAQIFASAGLNADGSVTRISRRARNRAFGILTPAEVALRALIVVASFVYGMPEVGSVRRKSGARKTKSAKRTGKKRFPAFRLFDPRKVFGLLRRKRPKGAGPRMFQFDGTDEFGEEETISPDDLVNAAALFRRLEAMRGALEDIPKQVVRLAREKARRERAGNPIKNPLRTGRRPGYRAKPRHYADLIARDCRQLARMAEVELAPPRPPDTS